MSRCRVRLARRSRTIKPMAEPAEATHANFLRALVRLGSLTERAEAVRQGAWLLIDAGLGLDQFNLAVVADVSKDPPADLSEAIEWHRGRGTCPRLTAREEADYEIIAEAVKRDFRVVNREPSMLLWDLPTGADLPPGLRVRVASGREDIEAYGRVDAPPWREVTLGIARTVSQFPDFVMLLGEVEGVPVATSMAVITGGLVGVYNVQVQREHRRRGLGRAMTAAALAVGRERGATAGALQATAMGEPLYQSMGFKTLYHYLELALPPPADGPSAG